MFWALCSKGKVYCCSFNEIKAGIKSNSAKQPQKAVKDRQGMGRAAGHI